MQQQITLTNGRIISLELSDDYCQITFRENGKPLQGEFCFKPDEFRDGRYQITRMYSPIKKNGLGEAALRFFIQETGAKIWTWFPDGQEKDDQSHLTEDAPTFVLRMQGKGLIEPWDDDCPDDY